MSTTEIIGDFGTLRIEQDQVNISLAIDGLGYIDRYTPGRTSYYLNDEPITPERYEELRAQFQSS